MPGLRLTRFRLNRRGIDALVEGDIEEWLTKVLVDAQREAKNEVNVDSGFLKSRIKPQIDTTGQRDKPIKGSLVAETDYAVWQETEPGDSIPGIGTRKRRGGRPFLRPGVQKALAPYTR